MKHQITLLDYDLSFVDFSASNLLVIDGKIKIIDYEGCLHLKQAEHKIKHLSTYAALTYCELILHAFFNSSYDRPRIKEIFGLQTSFGFDISNEQITKGLEIINSENKNVEVFLTDIHKMFEDYNNMNSPELYYSLIGKIERFFLANEIPEIKLSASVHPISFDEVIETTIKLVESQQLVEALEFYDSHRTYQPQSPVLNDFDKQMDAVRKLVTKD